MKTSDMQVIKQLFSSGKRVGTGIMNEHQLIAEWRARALKLQGHSLESVACVYREAAFELEGLLHVTKGSPCPLEPTDQWSVVVADGKYCVRFTQDSLLVAERYGEPWRDLVGDKLVYCLASELIEARRLLAIAQIDDSAEDFLEKEPPCP